MLSEQIKNTINGIRHQFPTEQALLLPLLLEIQERRRTPDNIENSALVMREHHRLINLPLTTVEQRQHREPRRFAEHHCLQIRSELVHARETFDPCGCGSQYDYSTTGRVYENPYN